MACATSWTRACVALKEEENMNDRSDTERMLVNVQTTISRRTLLKGMGTAGLMILAAACAPAATTAPSATTAPAAAATPGTAPTAAVTIKRGGTMNWGEVQDPISFDPHNR